MLVILLLPYRDIHVYWVFEYNMTLIFLFKSLSKLSPEYDILWYPEELLATLIDYISTKIHDLKRLEKRLGALLFSCNLLSSGVSGTTIYDSFDIIDDLNPFIRGFYRLKQNAKNQNAFKILFRNLRRGSVPVVDSDKTALSKVGDFTLRRHFLRC